METWSRNSRRTVAVYAFLLPALAIFFTFRVIPLIWNIVLSLQFWSPLQEPAFAGLYHYEELLFYDPVFWRALRNTLYFMLAGPIAVVTALGLALLVRRPIRGRNIYRTVIFLSYPLMTVSVGVIWQWLYNEDVGLINYMLLSSGLIDEPIAFLNQFSTALPAVMVAAIWQIVGFFMIIILTGLQSIPPHLYEAARIDGANEWQQFRSITLPLIRPSIFLCLILAVIASFTSFDLIYVMTGGGPGRATEVLITYIYKNGFELSQFDYAAALTVVTFGLFSLIAATINRISGGDAGKVDISA